MKAVNLGLSVMWGDCNVGATECYEEGALYSWNEIVPEVDLLTSLRAPVTIPSSMKMDLAEKLYGRGWQIPTIEHMIELVENCEFEFALMGKALRVTGPNGNSILLPLAGNDWHGNKVRGGFYWSSTKASEDNDSAYQLHISDNQVIYGYNLMSVRQSIRPIYCPKNKDRKNYNIVDCPIFYKSVTAEFVMAKIKNLCRELHIEYGLSEKLTSNGEFKKFPVATSRQILQLKQGNALGHGDITLLYSREKLVGLLIEKASKAYVDSVKDCGMVYGIIYASVTYGEEMRPDLINKLEPDDMLVWLI